MRFHPLSCPKSVLAARRWIGNHLICWLLLPISSMICMGLMAWPVALASHLTLPGSESLHHSDEFDPDPIIRQLDSINSYTPPVSRPQQMDRGTNSLYPSTERFPEPEKTVPLEEEPIPFLPHSATLKIPTPGISISKKDAQRHVNLGWRFLLDGRPEAAMAAYREALRHHPDSANAYVGMGITLKSMGNVNRAVQAIQQALDLNPQLSSALVHMGYLYADGLIGYSDPETARRLFDQASRLGDPFADIALQDLKSRTHAKF